MVHAATRVNSVTAGSPVNRNSALKLKKSIEFRDSRQGVQNIALRVGGRKSRSCPAPAISACRFIFTSPFRNTEISRQCAQGRIKLA